jgi:diguanylate cyclase (GGDEF)-like protein/PAS domain S-box-containing protein
MAIAPIPSILAAPAGILAVLSPAGLLESWNLYLFIALVVLLVFQQWRLVVLRKNAIQREELFRIVAENAADMIALVDVKKGRRLYNSPAYEKMLGYTSEELAKTSSFEQIHPEDRMKVLEAGREARRTGIGQKLEYRIQHKNGSWKILESTASTIKNADGEVEKLVIINRDITERKAAEEQQEHNSFHDPATGLPNRRLFLDRLERSFARAKRSPDYRYAVLLVDLDAFKEFNESMGTPIADTVIAEMGRRLAGCLRNDDTVARPKGKLPIADMLSRLGGDEFIVLLENIVDPSDALRVAKRIQAAVAAPFLADHRQVRVSASIGIALSTTPHDKAEDLLQDADVAMRRAKARGGARCDVFDEALHQQATRRLTLEAELQTAFEKGQFQLCYQPIVHLGTGQTSGFEALLRWQHPQQGLISPHKFIETAENFGLLVSIGKWVVGEAFRQLREWQATSPLPERLTMTVNISARQLWHPNFVTDMKSAIKEAGVEPGRLQLEINENSVMADFKHAAEVIHQLKQLGLRISVGDFGTGMSSITWLRRCPLDELKIDRSLINSMAADRTNCDVVQLIVMMGQSLKLRVVAEGVEGTEQATLLKNIGCEFGQGYFFSQPLTAIEAGEALERVSTPVQAAANAG